MKNKNQSEEENEKEEEIFKREEKVFKIFKILIYTSKNLKITFHPLINLFPN